MGRKTLELLREDRYDTEMADCVQGRRRYLGEVARKGLLFERLRWYLGGLAAGIFPVLARQVAIVNIPSLCLLVFQQYFLCPDRNS